MTALIDAIAEQLMKQLPHGSGVNYDWHYYIQYDGKIVFTNKYEVMNEAGFYVGVLPFKAVYKGTENGRIEFVEIRCENVRRKDFYGVKDYLEQLFCDVFHDYYIRCGFVMNNILNVDLFPEVKRYVITLTEEKE